MKKSESYKLATRRRIFLRALTKSQPKSLIRSRGYNLRQAPKICAIQRLSGEIPAAANLFAYFRATRPSVRADSPIPPRKRN